jgi:hypothetical protein
MVATVNGHRTLPAYIELNTDEARKVPSPGSQRLLKAQTGRTFDELMASDSADRFQTQIWVKLRRDFPDLLWSECEDVELLITDVVPPADPTSGSDSTTSPSSAGSGV